MGSTIYKPSVIALALSTASIGWHLSPIIPARHNGAFQGKGQRKANKANRWR